MDRYLKVRGKGKARNVKLKQIYCLHARLRARLFVTS